MMLRDGTCGQEANPKVATHTSGGLDVRDSLLRARPKARKSSQRYHGGASVLSKGL